MTDYMDRKPMLTRIPDFFINVYEDKDFDKHEFLVQNDKKVSRVSVEGHKYYIQYNRTEEGRTKNRRVELVEQ